VTDREDVCREEQKEKSVIRTGPYTPENGLEVVGRGEVGIP
jgi:hypothetical protein